MPFTDEEVEGLLSKGLSPEQVAQAEIEFDAQDAPKLGSFYEEFTKPGFAGDVVDAGVAGAEQMGTLFTKGVHNAMDGLGASNPVGLAVGLGQALYEGVDSLPEAADRSAGIAAGLVPGAQTGYQYAKDLYNDEVQPGGQYGKMLRGEAAGLVASAPLALAGGVAGRVIGNRGARTAAMRTAGEHPVSQAAIRFAENEQLLNSPAAQTALAKQNYSAPIMQNALREGVDKAKGLASYPREMQLGDVPAPRDALVGHAYGRPLSNSQARPRAAMQETLEAGPVVTESGLFHTDVNAPYNLDTGKFEPVPASTPLTVAQVTEKAQLAGQQILEHRRNVVGALDMALDNLTKNSRGSRTGAPVTGITFHGDLAPNIPELKALIEKRAKSIETQHMSESMQVALNNAQTALDNLGRNPTTNFKDLLGGPEQARGYARPSEVLDLIENYNAYRRSLGEFDRLAQAKGLQGDKTTLSQIDAETRAITQIQRALQDALESKAKELISLRGELQGQQAIPWNTNKQPGEVLLSDVMERLTDRTLPDSNKNFQAFSVMEDLGRERADAILAEGSVRGENTLIKTEQEAPQVSVTNPAGMFTNELNRRAGEYFFPQKTDPNIQRAGRVSAKHTGSTQQIIDGLLIRDREVPLLSRSWEKVKMSPDQLRKLDMMAVGLGLVAPNTIYQMSEPMQAMIHSEVISAAPMAAESVPGGYDVAGSDGLTFQKTPQAMIEQDFIAKKIQNAPLSEQARVMSALNQGKYVPLQGEAPVKRPLPARVPSLSEMSGTLKEVLNTPSSPETRDMLDDLNAKAARTQFLQDKGF